MKNLFTRVFLFVLSLVLAAGCTNSSRNEGGADPAVTLIPLFQNVPLSQPLDMHLHPSDDSRWFILQKTGEIIILDADTPGGSQGLAIDLSSRVDDSGEGGLLGMTFHPSFTESGDVFLSYTVTGEGLAPLTSIISRYHMAPDGIINPSSEAVILSVDQPYTNHNGGCIAFGPDDGFLYIGFGDGGSGGDPKGNGQDTTTIPGSILRVDVNGGAPYEIPAGNFFAGSSTDRPEIWAWGLRNPWRFSFDRQDRKLWAGDVGQGAWEEIDIIEGGGNYGWNIMEGNHCYGTVTCDTKSLILPVLEYNHDEGDRSITGGYVYRGSDLPALSGKYVFGDFISGRIWTMDASAPSSGLNLLADTSLNVVSFAQDHSGELYVVDFGGHLFRIAPMTE